MPSGRLQQQFIRLWQCCEGRSQEDHAERAGGPAQLFAPAHAHAA